MHYRGELPSLVVRSVRTDRWRRVRGRLWRGTFALTLLLTLHAMAAKSAMARPIELSSEMIQQNRVVLLSSSRACLGKGKRMRPVRVVRRQGKITLAARRSKSQASLVNRCKRAVRANNRSAKDPVNGTEGQCADMDGDLNLTSADISLFLDMWLARGHRADWNQDGRINSTDISAFLTDWMNPGLCSAPPPPSPTPTPVPPAQSGWTIFTPTSLDPAIPATDPQQIGSRILYVSKATSPVTRWVVSGNYPAGVVVMHPVEHAALGGPAVFDAFWRASGSQASGVAPGPGVAGWTAVRDPGRIYYWNGTHVVDDAGATYGTDPFNPQGIVSFYSYGTARATSSAWGLLRARYADWILFRRGESWTGGVDQFAALSYVEGRSPSEPSLHGAYGPEVQERPRFLFRAGGYRDIHGNSVGSFIWIWMRHVSRGNAAWVSLDAEPENPAAASRGSGIRLIGSFPDQVIADNLLFEDLRIDGMSYGVLAEWTADLTEHPNALHDNVGMSIRRSVITNIWAAGHHNQGAYISRLKRFLVEDSIFARNGYKGDPRIDDRRRDIFSRNFYLGSCDQMGVTLRNVVSANGGSGGPQMRCGGLIEDSLMLNEGYWYSATESNGNIEPWGHPQQGISAIVRNNVHFKWRSLGTDDDRAHPAWGYTAQGGTFGGEMYGNIFTGRHLQLNAISGEHSWSVKLDGTGDATRPTRRSNIQDNISYLAGPLLVDRAASTSENAFTNNTVVSNERCLVHLGSSDTMLSGNRCYTNRPSPFQTSAGGHTYSGFLATGVSQDDGTWQISPLASAGVAEGWVDPNRSVRSYLEHLGASVSSADGMSEFLADCTRQRKGFWRESCTARSVVNYVRAGFALEPLPTP